MDSIPDPYGDRQCHQRWHHREIVETVVLPDGGRLCPACYPDYAPEDFVFTPIDESETTPEEPNPPVEETPAPEQ